MARPSIVASIMSAKRDATATPSAIQPIVPEMAYKKMLNEIISANSDKNFVKRILTPNKYPTLDLGNGDYATHQMAWSDDGDNPGSYIVYPTVIHDEKNNRLVKMSDRDAYDYAIKNNELIRTRSPIAAEMISKDYKKLWQK